MERQPIYSESTLNFFVGVGRIAVNFLWISALISFVNSSTHWFSTYDNIEEEYVEDILQILSISFYISLPVTAIIWVIKDSRLNKL